MPSLTLQKVDVSSLKNRAAKKTRGRPNLAVSETSRLYSIVSAKGLVAGSIPRTSDSSPGGDSAIRAAAILESIGCTVVSSVTYPKDFSLERTQIQAPLDNKNIIDPNISTLANAQSSPSNKFTNDTDPFYEMDDTRAVYQQIAQETLLTATMVDTSQLCADVYSQNTLSGASKKIKQLL